MKISLSKKISFYKKEAYLKIKKEEERTDIQDYLEGKKSFKPLIDNRIKDYLKKVGVYDERWRLTREGNRVKETGKMDREEEGKYLVWICQDDFFENKIMYVERLRAKYSNKIQGVKPSCFDEGEHYCLPTKNAAFSKFYLLNHEEVFNADRGEVDSLEFRWEANGDLRSSYYVFQGEFNTDTHQREKIIQDPKILADKNLEEKLIDIVPNWDARTNRRKVYFSNLDDNEKLRLVSEAFTTSWNHFNVKVSNVPLVPADKDNAVTWRDWLMQKECKEKYLNQKDFSRILDKINAKEAFASFRLDQLKEVAPFEQKKEEWWHRNAPADLNPNIALNTGAKSVEIPRGRETSFKNIVAELGLENLPKDTVVFYCDKYVKRSKQQKAVATFLKGIRCEGRTIITLANDKKSSNYIKQNEPNIAMVSGDTVFKGSKFPHDRYLIIAIQSDMTIWNISNSIDYIRFSKEEDISLTSKGKIHESVTFTKLQNKQMLDKDLLNFIQQKIKNGN